MFFLASKLLDFLLLPPVWLLVLLVLALRTRRPRRRQGLLLTTLLLLVVLTNNALVNEALLAWELPPVRLSQLGRHDAAVLLSGISEGKKSPHDRVYLGRGADRLLHTLWLYRAGRVRRIIISGGSGALEGARARTEARELYVLLRLAGVPTRHLLLEERSRNTRENALYTKELLTQHPDIQSLVLVTSAFHQRRALGCFRQAGLNPTPFPAGFATNDRRLSPDYWLIPDPEAMSRWSMLLHEISGYLVYRVLGYA